MAQRKRNIEFSKPDEPSFLKKMKNQMGIQNDLVTIETKKEKLMKQDLEYRDEEPVYVVEENSDITEKELENFKEKSKQEKEFQKDQETVEKRIIFKKPEKKSNDNNDETTDSFQKNTTANKKSLNLRDKLKEKNKDKIKSVKNSSLLSFNDEEDEQEED